jgi:hypothetical protein
MKNLLRAVLVVSVAFAAGCGDDANDDDKQCVPETDQAFCARLDAVCGPLSGTDNCGAEREVADCGACGEGESCNTNKCQPGSCTAETDAEFCARLGAVCGEKTGKDNCGDDRTVDDCGTCSGDLNCIANECKAEACTPESDAEFCARQGAICGAKTGKDNCGDERTVDDCGTCSGDQVCIANKCEAPAPGSCNVPASYGAASVVPGSEFAAVVDSDLGDIWSMFDLDEDEYLYMELYATKGVFADGIKTGTFTLEGDDLNYATCGLCIQIEDGEGNYYFATGGTVELTSIADTLEARLSDVTFVEVTLDNDTWETTPVPDGCKTRIDSVSLSSPIEVY